MGGMRYFGLKEKVETHALPYACSHNTHLCFVLRRGVCEFLLHSFEAGGELRRRGAGLECLGLTRGQRLRALLLRLGQRQLRAGRLRGQIADLEPHASAAPA